jgi:hypothetical protein
MESVALIPLADMLLGLRRELLEAQEQAAKEQLRFRVEDIEVELKIGTTMRGATKTGISFWVLDAGAEGSIEFQKLQTLKLKLTPVDGKGDKTLVSDRGKK